MQSCHALESVENQKRLAKGLPLSLLLVFDPLFDEHVLRNIKTKIKKELLYKYQIKGSARSDV